MERKFTFPFRSSTCISKLKPSFVSFRLMNLIVFGLFRHKLLQIYLKDESSCPEKDYGTTYENEAHCK